MLTYNTSFSATAPSPRSPATPSPSRAYGQNHADVFAGLSGSHAADLGVAYGKANSEFDLKRADAQRQLVLQGLQQMANEKQAASALANGRMGLLTNGTSGLLQGLFQ